MGIEKEDIKILSAYNIVCNKFVLFNYYQQINII